MDTVTLVRSAIRGVLAAAGEREPALRSVLRRDDDYRTSGKPAADWDDAAARAALVDALARDGEALLCALEGEPLSAPLSEAAALLATVLGQDLEDGPDGAIRIARRVSPDRVISTVDPEARHGHKTDAHSFDGYKGHLALDPDAELVTATAVSPGNAGDASVVSELLGTELATPGKDGAPLTVYGDSAYGTGSVLAALDDAGAISRLKVQPSNGVAGHFTKDDFTIDLDAQTVTCPAGRVAPIRGTRRRLAEFGRACGACPLVARCTSSPVGRVVAINPQEALLAAGRAASRDPAWRADYRATRPRVERRIAHLVRRRHGGRRARVRGRLKVGADFALLAAAVNLARLAALGLRGSAAGWVAAPAS
jgi:IS5 family transposase